ncbi:MAG: S1/P1 nuclease, partial [Bacteroidota bacterium]
MTNTPPGPAEFSAPRHKTIGSLAGKFISDKPAAKEVQKLLKKIGAASLEEIAPWADAIKPTSRNLPSDKDTKDFLKKFPDTREWHFVDLPVDTQSYDTKVYKAFIREDDIVHTLVECINILMGQSAKFSKPNALRWLVHLAGDLHQPLHIAYSYIDFSKKKPELVFKKDEILSRNLLQKSDRGGNKINLPIG